MNITYADQKDLQRAHDLVTLTSRGGFDRAIGAATKMAKLIKDTDKLLRRTEAVLSKDLRLVGPFIDRCREISDWRLKNLVTAYDTGKTVGTYAASMPRTYSKHDGLLQAAFMAGFASGYGFSNFIGTSNYGI